MPSFSESEFPPTLAFSTTVLIETPVQVKLAAAQPLAEAMGIPQSLQSVAEDIAGCELSQQNCGAPSRTRLIGAVAHKNCLDKKVLNPTDILRQIDKSTLAKVHEVSTPPTLCEPHIARVLRRHRSLGRQILAVAPSGIMSSQTHRELLRASGLYDQIDDFVGSDVWEQGDPFKIMAEFSKRDSSLIYCTDSFGNWRQAATNPHIARTVLLRPQHRKSAQQFVRRIQDNRAAVVDKLTQPCDIPAPVIQ